MPYTIETQDGITIRDIPDNIAPDADVLKQRVAKLRAEREGTPATVPRRTTTPEQQVEQQPPQPVIEQQAQPQEPEITSLGQGAQSLLLGATLGFSEEIQSVLAAAVASPFVSDRSFGELMSDARRSFREEQAQFREEQPKTALGAEIVGGLVTGGIGAARALSATGAKQIAKQGAKIGAGLGTVAGAGFADAPELFSLDTALGAAIGTVAGGTIGAILPVAISAVASGIRSITKNPGIKIFDETGKFTNEALEELDNLVSSGKATSEEIDTIISRNLQDNGVLTAEQAERFNLFKSRGVEPTRADVIQSTDLSVQQQSALKRTGPVSDRISEQNQSLINAVDSGIEKIGPATTTVQDTNASVFNVVDNVVNIFDDTVNKAYAAAKIESRGQPLVSFDNFTKAISDNRGKERISGGVISAIRQTLKNKGLIKKGVNIAINKRGKRVSGKDIKKLTVQEAEEIRQELNSLFSGSTPQGKKLIRDLKNALDTDVAESIGEDLFIDARLAKVRFQDLIERGKRNKFDKTKGGFLEDVIDNKIPEEKILSKLLIGRDDDFIKFKKFLTQDAGESGINAFNNIKAQVLRNALDKAIGTAGKTEGGQRVFNARLFKNEFNKLKATKKFEELFNPDERKLIEDIIEIGQLRVPLSSAQSGKGPTELAVKELGQVFVRKIPVIGEKAIGLLDDLINLRSDRALLNVTKQTEAVLKRTE